MGSLNGTLLNSRSVSHPDLGSRKWGHPVELASDDVITLGTTTMLSVSLLSEWFKKVFVADDSFFLSFFF